MAHETHEKNKNRFGQLYFRSFRVFRGAKACNRGLLCSDLGIWLAPACLAKSCEMKLPPQPRGQPTCELLLWPSDN